MSFTQPSEPFINARQAAAFLGRHVKTVQRAAHRGELPGHFKLGRWYFLESELRAWLTGRQYPAQSNDVHITA